MFVLEGPIEASSLNSNFITYKVCSELSTDLSTIVKEEHSILDNPITSPPHSFPTKLHRLHRLNNCAQQDIMNAKHAWKECLNTLKEMSVSLEVSKEDMISRACTLERER